MLRYDASAAEKILPSDRIAETREKLAGLRGEVFADVTRWRGEDAPPAALHDIDTEDPETVLTGLPGAAGSAHVEVSDIRTSLDAAVPHAFLARTRT